jgi:hypothetical protein
MYMNIRLPLFGKKEEENAKLENDRLLIDCRACGNTPDISGTECIRCIVSSIVILGEPERILLRTSRDTEFVGDTVQIMNRLAEADVLTCSLSSGKRCSSCSCEPSMMMKIGWETFPEPNTDAPRAVLRGFEPENKECEDCVIATYRSLEQIDYAMKDAMRFAARSSFMLTDV